MKKKYIIGIGIILVVLVVGLFVYLWDWLNWFNENHLLIQCNQVHPLNGQVYYLDKNVLQMNGGKVWKEEGIVYFLRALDQPKGINAVSGNGMMIGSTLVENLEQFFDKKIKVKGRRYMGDPMLIKDVELTDELWKNIPVIELISVELVE
jgi:hypothetical protein